MSLSFDHTVLRSTGDDEDKLEKEEWVRYISKDPLGPHIPLVSRYSWRAKDPSHQENMPPGPLIYVRFTYTGTEMTLWPDCIAELRILQHDQMKYLGYPDIAYNFMIGADGTVYEGRGWNVEPTRPPGFEPLKGKCLDIGYIGEFKDQPIPWLMVNAGVDLIKYGVKGRLIHPLYQTIQYNEDSIVT
ncbi:peptidoglycan-recognition protein LF-like [Macrosteles quadrilineatus]|uniref:peptidoglycan-recognition protein LF-like n=1 Tax=Macrosteles quadrilineatus TaxID=74068 RepID=UPI0023E31B0D|nr:peptidoglycan-recognition protein LF-like [Macrosteles quadrilineatus]